MASSSSSSLRTTRSPQDWTASVSSLSSISTSDASSTQEGGDPDRVLAYHTKECDFHGQDFDWKEIAARYATHREQAGQVEEEEDEEARRDVNEDEIDASLAIRWDTFYSTHPNFFQPKRYLYKAWPDVLNPTVGSDSDGVGGGGGGVVVFGECGCGIGSCMYSVLARHPTWKCEAFDFSVSAIDFLKVYCVCVCLFVCVCVCAYMAIS